MSSPPLIRARDLLEIGQDPRQLASRCRRGELVRVRRGLYVPAERWAELDPASQYGLQARALQLVCERPPVFCHATAALLWGLWLVGLPQRIHVITESEAGGRSRNTIVRHVGSLSSGVVRCGDTLLTDKLTTTLHLIETLPFPLAVAICDSALREPHGAQEPEPFRRLGAPAGLGIPGWRHDEPLGAPLHRAELAAAAGKLPTAAARRRALTVVAFASPLSGSAGESLSRAHMHQLGFPPPILQHRFALRNGGNAYTDFWFEEQRVAGEFDGQGKYRRSDWGGGASLTDRIMAEKHREDQIREHGVRVVRWTWAEMMNTARFAQLLTAAGLPQRPH